MAVDKEILPSLKPLIKELYLGGKDVPELCDLFSGLPTSTVYNWIKNEKWKELRNSKVQQYINTPDVLMSSLDTMLNELQNGKIELDDGKEIPILSNPRSVVQIADAVSKIVKSIKSLRKEKDYLSSIVFSVNLLAKFMNENNEQDIYDDIFCDKLVKLLSAFETDCIKKYSPKNFK
ncbi:MAG: hypothetical protein K1X86_16820 [Ignavibacteria bacterium]|nr:hypothetical protein [Ignavibacteria bacterium]